MTTNEVKNLQREVVWAIHHVHKYRYKKAKLKDLVFDSLTKWVCTKQFHHPNNHSLTDNVWG